MQFLSIHELTSCRFCGAFPPGAPKNPMMAMFGPPPAAPPAPAAGAPPPPPPPPRRREFTEEQQVAIAKYGKDVKPWSDAVKEVKTCVQYARNILV